MELSHTVKKFRGHISSTGTSCSNEFPGADLGYPFIDKGKVPKPRYVEDNRQKINR